MYQSYGRYSTYLYLPIVNGIHVINSKKCKSYVNELIELKFSYLNVKACKYEDRIFALSFKYGPREHKNKVMKYVYITM